MFTPTYAAALDWVAERMRGAGLETRVDAFGNLWGRWEGSEPDAPRVITGSHVDTTLNAGRYDGVVGVLGAIEAVRSLRDAGFVPRRGIEVVAVAGEEPRFGTGCIGSRALVGALGPDDLDALRDRDGVSLAEALRGAGFDPAGSPTPARSRDRARVRRAAHRAGRRARGGRRADRRRHRDRGAARLPARRARRARRTPARRRWRCAATRWPAPPRS